MTEQSREQISALMDGELENGTPFNINVLEDNQEYRQIWHRYHLIGESLRGNLSIHIDMRLADKIRSSIQTEPAILAPVRNTVRNQLLKPAIGFAIAASVTVAVILVVQQTAVGPASTQPPAVAAVTKSSADYPVVRVTAEPSTRTAQTYQVTADAQSRLNRYLVNHNEYRSSAGVQGMLPYVRIVAHEVEE